MVKNQSYPQNRIEWLIYDDGTDKIADLVEKINNVRYFYNSKKNTIGYKRNFLNKKSKGDIIVNMDDDDIYSKDRVEHAVNKLKNFPDINIVGCSEIYVLLNNKDIWKLGPYYRNHATAGTFAYRKELLNYTSYDNNSKSKEESIFLKNYSIPLIQLEPIKTILNVSHDSNTVNKEKIIENHGEKIKAKKCENFEEIIKHFSYN